MSLTCITFALFTADYKCQIDTGARIKAPAPDRHKFTETKLVFQV